MTADDKYMVFKRDDFLPWMQQTLKFLDQEAEKVGYPGDPAPPPAPLDDAVVIRTKDVFAGPALHSYAACIAIAMKFVPKTTPTYADMEISADYFHARAMEADEIEHSGEAKVPD